MQGHEKAAGVPDARGCRSQIYETVVRGWSERGGNPSSQSQEAEGHQSRREGSAHLAAAEPVLSRIDLLLSYKNSYSKVSLPPPPSPALQGPGGASPLCNSPVPWGQGDNSSALSLGAAFPCLPGAGPAIPEGGPPAPCPCFSHHSHGRHGKGSRSA